MPANQLKEIRKIKRISQSELGQMIGVDRATIRNWETGQTNISVKMAEKVAEVLGVTVSQLLGQEADEVMPDNSDKFLLVPVVEIEACAGNGNEYPEFTMNVVSVRPIPKNDLIGHSWQCSGFKIFTISGDSMEPRFSDGDDVLVSVDEQITTGNIVVAWWRGKLYIRGFIEHQSMVVLKPLNAKYSPIEIEKGDTDLYIIGKVIARVPQIEKVDGIF